MDSYHVLSAYYDRFTQDIDYARWADFFEQIFNRIGISPRLVLDLACGTGSLSHELARRGYEMICVDASAEMLMQAMNNGLDLDPRPLYLQQRMECLDLYGTVDACLCCLDSINYITDPALLREAIRRIELFLEPGGVFIFDVNSLKKFERMHDQCYVREDEDVYCAWQVDFDGELCCYEFDIFSRQGQHWMRHEETHHERYYAPDMLTNLLSALRFTDIVVYPELSFASLTGQEDRIFISARKRKDNEG